MASDMVAVGSVWQNKGEGSWIVLVLDVSADGSNVRLSGHGCGQGSEWFPIEWLRTVYEPVAAS